MKNVRTGTLPVLLCLMLLLSVLTGCGGEGASSKTSLLDAPPEARCAVTKERTYDHSMKLTYADRFAVDYYAEGDCLVTVCDDRQYYLTGSGDVPKDLSDGVTVLNVPLNDIYIAGTAGMDYFVSCDALGNLRFSSQQASAWKIPEAVSAMEDGALLFAGKYSTPDYELLTSERCDLALENTMIYHSPAVIEQLESLGIPVFIDNSSNETTPQGRMEWVKVFGLLAGREAEADRAFRAQEKEFEKLESIADRDAVCPSVAFFSVRSNGTVTVRQATDYIPKMIDIAGGRYVFEDLRSDGEGMRSTQVISMEEFYSTAKDADYFILNSSIEGERTSVDELLKDARVLADCKAVREGHVYCTYADLYQHSMGQGDFVRDLHEMLTGGTDFTYIFKLDE